jgi:hypothetical protein
VTTCQPSDGEIENWLWTAQQVRRMSAQASVFMTALSILNKLWDLLDEESCANKGMNRWVHPPVWLDANPQIL